MQQAPAVHRSGMILTFPKQSDTQCLPDRVAGDIAYVVEKTSPDLQCNELPEGKNEASTRTRQPAAVPHRMRGLDKTL